MGPYIVFYDKFVSGHAGAYCFMIRQQYFYANFLGLAGKIPLGLASSQHKTKLPKQKQYTCALDFPLN